VAHRCGCCAAEAVRAVLAGIYRLCGALCCLVGHGIQTSARGGGRGLAIIVAADVLYDDAATVALVRLLPALLRPAARLEPTAAAERERESEASSQQQQQQQQQPPSQTRGCGRHGSGGGGGGVLWLTLERRTVFTLAERRAHAPAVELFFEVCQLPWLGVCTHCDPIARHTMHAARHARGRHHAGSRHFLSNSVACPPSLPWRLRVSTQLIQLTQPTRLTDLAWHGSCWPQMGGSSAGSCPRPALRRGCHTTCGMQASSSGRSQPDDHRRGGRLPVHRGSSLPALCWFWHTIHHHTCLLTGP
jgi:hypothetical protein